MTRDPLARQAVLPFEEEVTVARRDATPPAPPRDAPPSAPDSPISFVFVRSPRARRYILRLRPDGVVRVTIPARGSKREAIEVVERHRAWIDRQWQLRMAERRAHDRWDQGTRFLYRGEEVALAVSPAGTGSMIAFGDQHVVAPRGSVRSAIEGRLRELAERELVPRVHALAARHHLDVGNVAVRNQRTRWGSCSRAGNISLNWRLIQMPPFVCEYILLHELMHLKQANHSRRFWREVAKVCPDYRQAEAWLRRHGRTLW